MSRRGHDCSDSAIDDGVLPSFPHAHDNNNDDQIEHYHSMSELVLDDPAETPPPLYSTKEDEYVCSIAQRNTDINNCRPKSTSNAASIYDFLDQVEMKSVQQLELASASPFHGGGGGKYTLPPLLPSTSTRKDQSWVAAAPPSARSSATSLSVARSSSSSSDNNQYYAEIREKIVTLNIELQDKTQTIELLHAARKKDKAKAKEKVCQVEAACNAKLADEQSRLDKEIDKQLTFAQTLVADKAELVRKCELLAVELKKAQERVARDEEAFQRQMKDAKERWSVQEKVRRDQWIVKKTDEIKKSTIKALEPDVQAIMTKCKENLDKARDAAVEEKKKLQIALEKDKDESLRRQRDEYDKKLVEAREKERSKLMYRLDAADAELQQQLNQQRRRLQDEAEKARNDLVLEMRQLKVQHSRDVDEMRVVERQRIEHELTQLHKDKEDVRGMGRRMDAEAAALREKCAADVEASQAKIAAALRLELTKEKTIWEAEMLKRRDEKIEMVIDKLQAETQKKVEAAEKRLAEQFETDKRDVEKKLRAAAEMEHMWMEKNRELFEKCAKMEEARDAATAAALDKTQAMRAVEDKLVRCTYLLQEERERHDKERVEGTKHVDVLRHEYDAERDALKNAVGSLQSKLEMMEQKHAAQVHEIRSNHDDVLDKLHTRVRATIAKKDEMIEALREELHIAQVRIAKCEAIINEQRAQLFT
ncbi:Aste57867_15485 [Aphanomyces stellatus]|uniref:Aste57867_15485 protein n=1 Tax=Aphanomyces stellatus TaxID=120398 RepID=A0A485L388_9STRA|nr:hypothetical protein As57867_015429 [Aphanomyces stellatus]VFT92287.1 Aste57867_15485 [Aphanomyces stellatus]